MKKLFGVTKEKPKPVAARPEDAGHHRYPSETFAEDERQWEIVQEPPPTSRTASLASLPPGASPPLPNPRAPSPFGTLNATPRSHHLKKKQNNSVPSPGPLGLLRSLDPSENGLQRRRSKSEDRDNKDRHTGDHDRKEKKAFWSWDKDKDKKSSDDGADDLTKMIGMLTSTPNEDWPLTLEVCERASLNEHNAKEAARALRREFKYGQPQGQLAAARLWAVMLRNCSDLFVAQCTTRKFTETLDDLLMKSNPEPVVKDRLTSVIAAAAFASGSKKDTGFKALWRHVKPTGAPEEGIPFDPDDVIFSQPIPAPPSNVRRMSTDVLSAQPRRHKERIDAFDGKPLPDIQDQKPRSTHKHRERTAKGMISVEEDIRRLFQECRIGKGNASLLSEALVMAQPEDLHQQEIIREFYAKCRVSQELICAQIDWATAGADRSRRERESRDSSELTKEEDLLASLLAANAELMEALRQYDDLERVALERKTEDLSLRETRMDRRTLEHSSDLNVHVIPTVSHPLPAIPLSRSRPASFIQDEHTLVPPATLFGPRSPAFQGNSRTPSPRTRTASSLSQPDSSDKIMTLTEPSEKALGKRRVVDSGVQDSQSVSSHNATSQDMEDLDTCTSDSGDSDASRQEYYYHQIHHKPKFVYDAVAERSRDRLKGL